MVWYLLLAHFIADYPLQPGWMVRKKTRLDILALHVAVHLLVMVAIVGSARSQVWSYLLALAIIHFMIDLGKNVVNAWRPKWVIIPYGVDQAIHYLSIWLISDWSERAVGPVALPVETSWLIFTIGYLLVTYVWFISERILVYSDASYFQEVEHQLWPRMIARSIYLSLFLWFRGLFPLDALALSTVLQWPYVSGRYRGRALLIDIGVALGVIFFIQIVQ